MKIHSDSILNSMVLTTVFIFKYNTKKRQRQQIYEGSKRTQSAVIDDKCVWVEPNRFSAPLGLPDHSIIYSQKHVFSQLFVYLYIICKRRSLKLENWGAMTFTSLGLLFLSACQMTGCLSVNHLLHCHTERHISDSDLCQNANTKMMRTELIILQTIYW